MEKAEQWWWDRMFTMYAKLVEEFDNETFVRFKEDLSSIPYTYAKPREVLGLSARYIRDIVGWNVFVYEKSLEMQNFEDAQKYLERALDYFCAPTLDFDERVILEAKKCMQDLVANCLLGIYEGCHEIYDI